ncbi:MAG: methyltransferase domain-containing protein [Candidatus Lokiarchaeota archaeon]
MSFLFILLVVAKIVRKIHPFPIPAFLTRLIDNPIRRKFMQQPEKLADRLDLKPGMTVIEVGPGKGNYTKAIAKKVSSDGRVYAIDIQEWVIEKLKKRLEEENIKNIEPKIDDAYALSFQDNSIDRIFLNTCLPEIPEPVRALKEFRRVLKKGGFVSMSELFLDPDYPFRSTEKRWAKEAGLDLKSEFGNWFTYQLNFQK